jgi:hypothetical protein
MPIVDENHLKGNYAASYVATRLSAYCLVRPVASDTDVGIDLYCETIAEKEREPHLHFWLQVKSGKQCNVNKKGSKASCAFKKDHLEYWDKQPVPVFAALVPIKVWPISKNPKIYVVPITKKLVFNIDLEKINTFKRLYSEWLWMPNSKSSIKEFLNLIVPEVTAQMECKKGIVAEKSEITPKYERNVPFVPVSRFNSKISVQIRHTAARLILFLYLQGKFVPSLAKFRKRLAKILDLYPDDKHWETHMARAISHNADGNFSLAVDL